MYDRTAQASINAADAGNNTIVAAVPNRSIVVLIYSLVCSGAVTVTWESGGGTVISGPCAYAANGGITVPEAQRGHFQTLPGEALVLDLSGAVQVGGHVVYELR